ncbi:MAG: MFS transporter [Sterolibacterium sp.]|nr:MFS transporter [Sterolibacterium sp.]
MVAALFVAVFVNVGFSSYGSGLINALMAKELNFDRSILGLGQTMFVLTMGFAAPGVAWGIKSVGARITVCFGSLLVAFGALFLAHVATEAWHFILAFGVVMGLGSGFGSVTPAQACITLWFEKNRGLAISIALAASGVGGFVAAPLLNKVITAAGGNWRIGWDFVAALAVLAGLVSLLFIKNRPADYGQLPDGRTTDTGPVSGAGADEKSVSIHRSADDWLLRDALRTRAFWVLVLAALSFVLSISVFVPHAVPHLQDLGHSTAVATLALGTIALSNTVGKLVAGFLCDRFEPRYVWFVAMLAIAVGVFLVIGAKSSAEIYIFAICLGAGYGASLVCWPSMIANYFGAGAFATILGAQTPIVFTISGLMPYVVGLAYDIQGSYNIAFTAIAALSLGCGILVLLSKPPRYSNATGKLVDGVGI